jgi:hypothetical protein
MRIITRILRRFLHSCPTLTLDDPVFGEMRGQHVQFHRDEYVYWEAERPFDLFGEDATVCVFSDQDGPTDTQRSQYLELKKRYPVIRQLMEKPLADEYEQTRSVWQFDSLHLESPSDIWKVARLSRVEVNQETGGRSQFVFDHIIDWEAGHDLNVVVTDWKVDEVRLEG